VRPVEIWVLSIQDCECQVTLSLLHLEFGSDCLLDGGQRSMWLTVGLGQGRLRSEGHCGSASSRRNNCDRRRPRYRRHGRSGPFV
jgi:hypothetical protein